LNVATVVHVAAPPAATRVEYAITTYNAAIRTPPIRIVFMTRVYTRARCCLDELRRRIAYG
jgi:hypothetical protein